MIFNVSSYPALASAITAASVKPGSSVVVDVVPQPPTSTVTISSIMELVFAQGISSAKSPGCGVLLDAPCGVYGFPGVTSITGSQYSGLMVTPNASGSVLDGVSIANFNTKALNPQAAFFFYSDGSPVTGIRARNLSATNGHGNCLRLANVYDCIFRDCDFSSSLAESNDQSAEGITVDGSKVILESLRMDRACTSGILVWPGANRFDIKILNCTVSNSSQAVLAPPKGINQVGSNFAYVVDAQQYTLTGLVFDGNTAYDDQAKPTQEALLQIGNGLRKGKVLNICVPDTNPHWGNINDTEPFFYNFDDEATELVWG